MRRLLVGVAFLLGMVSPLAGCSTVSTPTAPGAAGADRPALGFGVISAAEGASPFALCLSGAASSSCFTAKHIGANDVPVVSALAPGAPLNLVASSSGSSVTLSWNASSGADPLNTYVIEAGSAPGLANLANFATGNTQTIFQASGIGAGTYYVRVRAASVGGISPPSNEAVLVVGGSGPCVAPGAPTGLVVVFNTGGVVTLAWIAAAGAPTSYLVEAGSAPGLANLANSNLGLTTSLTATSVAAGTYYVRIRARNACGPSGPSNELVLRVGSGTVPNVSGIWSLTRTGSQSVRYNSFIVTLVQSGSCLTGNIRPIGESDSTPILDSCLSNRVSADGRVVFGSESPYWDDYGAITTDAYFDLRLDSTLNRMTGTCHQLAACRAATAIRIR
jgi:Fibronectin type III domain